MIAREIPATCSKPDRPERHHGILGHVSAGFQRNTSQDRRLTFLLVLRQTNVTGHMKTGLGLHEVQIKIIDLPLTDAQQSGAAEICQRDGALE